MIKLLKGLGLLAALLVILAISGYIYINTKGIPTYPVEEITYTAVSSPEILERGKKLTSILCSGCHMDTETGLLTGKQLLDAPKEFGTIFSKNITQDIEYGIGDWTDAELYYLLRTGITRDGNYIPPYMAKLTVMADEDVNAIIAFLKSDDPLVAAVNVPDQETKPGFLTKMLSNIAWKPMPLPTEPISMPDTTNIVELGKYLALNLECFSCHSESFKTNDYLVPENSKGLFGGGNKMLNMEGDVIYTSNLTPHESGIGNWSEETFVKALRFGVVNDEYSLRFPMIPHAQLTDKEAGAIYAYLRSLPAIDNTVDRDPN